MFEFSVSKDMKKGYNKKGGNMEGCGPFMSYTVVQKLKTSVEQGRVVTT